MPNANQPVRFIGCASASYAALGVYNENTIYFLTDTVYSSIEIKVIV